MEKTRIRGKLLFVFATLYILIPNIIFILGYVKLYISIPLSILLIASFYFSTKDFPTYNIDFFKYRKKIIFICCILAIWIFLSGVGGLCWQNRWDHKFRNAVFRDLVSNSWPVSKGGEKLCYYFGYWLPSALVGKIFGLSIGYFSQFVFAIIGVVLVALLIFNYNKKVNFRTIFILIFFSGMDAVVFMINHSGIELIKAVCSGQHIELLLNYFNSSSNTTLLFWLYNQIIPFWVGFMLLLSQSNNKNKTLTFCCMVLFCPFPAVALAPVMAYWLFFKNTNEGQFAKRIKQLISLRNLAFFCLALIVSLFFMSNQSAAGISVLPINVNTLLRFIAFAITDLGIYLVLLWNRKDIPLHILLTVTAICSFVAMGNSYDFAWRTCIPLSFYLMLLAIKFLNEHLNSKKGLILCLVLCIGMITPMCEVIRTFRSECKVIVGETTALSDSLSSVFEKENNECRDNFVSDGKGVFWDYLAK